MNLYDYLLIRVLLPKEILYKWNEISFVKFDSSYLMKTFDQYSNKEWEYEN